MPAASSLDRATLNVLGLLTAGLVSSMSSNNNRIFYRFNVTEESVFTFCGGDQPPISELGELYIDEFFDALEKRKQPA